MAARSSVAVFTDSLRLFLSLYLCVRSKQTTSANSSSNLTMPPPRAALTVLPCSSALLLASDNDRIPEMLLTGRPQHPCLLTAQSVRHKLDLTLQQGERRPGPSVGSTLGINGVSSNRWSAQQVTALILIYCSIAQ